jgi:hypothetical protein
VFDDGIDKTTTAPIKQERDERGGRVERCPSYGIERRKRLRQLRQLGVIGYGDGR